MRRRALVAVVLLQCALCTIAHAAASKVEILHPRQGTRMWLPIAHKNSLYYRLESGESALVPVAGPGELKCLVRVIPERDDTPEIPYTVVVAEDNRLIKTVRTKSVPGALKWKDRDELAANSRSFKIRVPRGDHVLRFTYTSPVARAAGVRYVFRRLEERGPQAPLQPLRGAESVDILVNERPLGYYLADARTPVAVEVIGPTRLRVVSRLVFPDRARGRQRYGLHIEQDGQALPAQTFVTAKSSVAECKAYPEWILARSRSFYVEVPKGSHVIRLRLSKSRAPHVAVRFSIPDESISNGS